MREAQLLPGQGIDPPPPKDGQFVQYVPYNSDHNVASYPWWVEYIPRYGHFRHLHPGDL